VIRLRAPKRPQAIRVARPMSPADAAEFHRLMRQANYHLARRGA